jgi:hypothetical protein
VIDVMVAKTPGKKLPRCPRRTPASVARHAEAVKLKVAGSTYDDIARVLGYADHSGARLAVKAGLNARLDASGTEELRQIELERLERLQLSRWELALDPGLDSSDAALDRVLRIMKRRAELLGLDAPVKLQHSGHPDHPVVVKVIKGVTFDELGPRS